MEEHCIRISYTGEFNPELTSVLLGMSKGREKMGAVQIKVYNIMIESLENIVRHASKSVESPYPAIFILAQDESFHYVCTGNKIHKDDISSLKEKIDKVNSLTREELRAWYNDILVNGETPNDSRGAGLGIIDMALKSRDKLHYDFTPINESSAFFVLKIKVKS